jgi:hypothetical protein
MIEAKEWFSSITITTWSGGAMPKTLVWGTVKDTFVLWVTPPPLAVTVTLEVPVIAVLPTLNVNVELPPPGAAIDAGLKLAVTPVGNPDAERDTAELNPPVTDVEIVVLPEFPCVTERLAGDALTVKFGAAAGLMVSATVDVCVTPPPLAVTVILEVPVVAVPLALNVRVELPLLGAAIEPGLKLAVTPAGSPDADNATAELKPPVVDVEIVVLPEEPCVTDRLAGEAPTLKSAVVPGLKITSSIGCSSIPLGATPVCPCRKSNMPTPLTWTGIFAVWKLVVAVNLALNSERAF